MGAAQWVKTIFWDATWANNVAWIESLSIAFVFATIFRDRLGRKVAKWWQHRVAPAMNAEVHEKISDLRSMMEQMNDHIHNGLFDDLHERFDDLIQKLPQQTVTVNIDNDSGPQEEPMVIVDETQPSEN